MKKVLVFGLVGVVLITGIILFIVFNSKNSYYNIKIMDTIGTVKVDRANKALDAYGGMKMRDKDYLRVASDGFSRIDCDNKTYSNFEHDSEASFVADSDKKLMINLVKGEMVVELQRKLTDEETLMVRTPNTTIAIRGTVVAVRAVPGEDGTLRTINYCLEGKSLLTADGVSEELEAGEGWLIVTDDSGDIVESKPALADEFEFAGIDLDSLKGADNAPMVLNYSGVSDNTDGETIELNETNFPDPAFRNFLAENIDTDKDGFLSPEERVIDSLNLGSLGIKDLKGIEYFGLVKQIYCSGNELETLDLTGNIHLLTLYCSSSKISTLDLSNCIELDVLHCSNNLLKELDLSNCTKLRYLITDSNQLRELNLSALSYLEVLNCSNNVLSNLDLSNNLKLKELNIKINTIENIDISKNTNLEKIYFDQNRLSVIDLSKNTKLTYIFIGTNNLTSIDVSKNIELTQLDIHTNKLTSIDLSNNKELELLECSRNDLTELDVSKNTKLTNMDCGFNNLTKLDVSNNTLLNRLVCYYNDISTLDIRNNPQLETFRYDEDKTELIK